MSLENISAHLPVGPDLSVEDIRVPVLGPREERQRHALAEAVTL